MTGEVVPGPFLRTPYNYDVMAASDNSALVCEDPSLAQQNGKEEADINTIVKRFGLTGELPDNVRVPEYGDFADALDYQSSLNLILQAQAGFMEMPADVRDRFNNDPGKFLEFVNNPENLDEARKLGIAKPAVVVPPVEPMLVRVVPDAEGASK